MTGPTLKDPKTLGRNLRYVPPLFDFNTIYAIPDGCHQPYLEAQTESFAYAIQSVLSSLRAPTLSPTLNENLTQIITIVSSIVAALQRQPSSPLCPTRQ